MSDALVKTETALARPQEPVDILRARYDKLQKRDLSVVDGMNRFAELPSFVEEVARQELIAILNTGTDAEIEAKYGFKNKKDLRVAMYGTLPKKDWPAAMQAAHERVLARQRKQSNTGAKTVFNLNMVSIPAPQPQTADDRVIIVEAEERK